MFPKISPIIPVRRRNLFESAEWVYELKHDGFRALAGVGVLKAPMQRHRLPLSVPRLNGGRCKKEHDE